MSETTLRDRFQGSLLCLALGDALGAPLEGGLLERFVWRCITLATRTKLRWSDDTQMSLDTAESLIAKGGLDVDDLAQRYAHSYRWSRGYGPGAARLLKQIRRGSDWREANQSIYPNGSFGNGGAMRAPVIGLFYYAQPAELVEAARGSARITHAHPLGMEGAVLIAFATSLAVQSRSAGEIMQSLAARAEQEPFRRRLVVACRWLETGASPSAIEVRKSLGNGIAAADSCVTAAYLAARFLNHSFEEMLRFVAACRGDVDTIGAMAGGIWGAANGIERLPQTQLHELEQRDRLITVAKGLCDRMTNRISQ